MKTKSRIESIINTASLGSSISAFQTFNLSELDLQDDFTFTLPTNIRLGHLVEKIVSEAIKISSNYNVLYENIQLLEDKITIGEIDFIVEHIKTKKLTHLELAYKFYLLDPSISKEQTHNWIGPNRNDTLQNKLEKLKSKQFPLLQSDAAANAFHEINTSKVSQALCLLASLFLPFDYKGDIEPDFKKAIKGYYINFQAFNKLDHSSKSYYIPSKKEWGMDPKKNEKWINFVEIEQQLRSSLEEKQSVLFWENNNGVFATNFIVWW